MNGNIILVLTSFREGDVTKKRDKYRMNSILRASEPDTGAESTGAESIVAIPLTEKILEDALRWLKGNTDTGEDSLANGQTERTLEELVTAYLDSLSKAIPAKSDCKTLMDFIRTHDWPDGSLEEMLEELEKKGHDENMEKSYFLRGFIHQNLARKTKVVAHVVDGNHRAAALNCALSGSGDDVEAKNEYYENFPHDEKNVVAVIIVPIEPMNNIFAHQMRSISQKSQSTCSKQQSHTIRENLFHLIEILRKQCLQKKISYLWSDLGEEMRKDAESITLFTYLQQMDYSCFEKYTKLVTGWIDKVSGVIINVLENEADNLDLSKGDQDMRNLFKAKKFPTSADYEENSHIFPFSKSNMLAKFLVDDPNDVFREKRFWRTGFIDKDLITVQILLWAMISKEANQHLRLLFSNSNPKQHQQLKPNAGTESEDAWKWTMSFFHNVTESVKNSYDPWKKNFFVADPKIPIQCNQDMVIYLCLLISAIKECAPFFMDVGTNPIWPEQLETAIKKINMNMEGENNNLVTFYTKAHSIAMTRGAKIKNQILMKIYLDHWRMKWEHFTSDEKAKFGGDLKKCVVRVRGRNYPVMANLLNRFTIGGINSPDPRGLKKNYKLIEIIGSNVDPNNYEGTESFYSTQIHQFVKVLPKDSTLLDLVKNGLTPTRGGKVIGSKKKPLSLEVDRGSTDASNNLGDENHPSLRAPLAQEVDRGSIDANPSLLVGDNVGADGTSPSPTLHVINALLSLGDNVGEGTGSDVPTRDNTAVGAVGGGGKESVPVQDEMNTSPTVHIKNPKKARKVKSKPENIPSVNNVVDVDLANEFSKVYDLADFWDKQIKPILKDEEFAEAKKLIDDALRKIQPENNLGQVQCRHCDTNSLTWSPFCEEHMKIFTKKYSRKKQPKRGFLALTEETYRYELHYDDDRRADMAAMHGNGADNAGGVIDFDAIRHEGEEPRRKRNPYVLDEASEGARDGSSIGELSLATDFLNENFYYEGDVTFKSLVAGLDANDLIHQGMEHFNKQPNNKFGENFNADESCDWRKVGLCQVCGTGASLIPCHKEGCQYQLHKQCQTMWEDEDMSRKSDGNWCSDHHPTYSNCC
jgi:hypothetical protein